MLNCHIVCGALSLHLEICRYMSAKYLNYQVTNKILKEIVVLEC